MHPATGGAKIRVSASRPLPACQRAGSGGRCPAWWPALAKPVASIRCSHSPRSSPRRSLSPARGARKLGFLQRLPHACVAAAARERNAQAQADDALAAKCLEPGVNSNGRFGDAVGFGACRSQLGVLQCPLGHTDRIAGVKDALAPLCRAELRRRWVAERPGLVLQRRKSCRKLRRGFGLRRRGELSCRCTSVRSARATFTSSTEASPARRRVSTALRLASAKPSCSAHSARCRATAIAFTHRSDSARAASRRVALVPRVPELLQIQDHREGHRTPACRRCGLTLSMRAHIFLCMLACYLEWHMREGWRELMFADTEQEAKAMRDLVGHWRSETMRPSTRPPHMRCLTALRRTAGAP